MVVWVLKLNQGTCKGVDIIIGTPGRFLDLYLRGGIETKKIKTLVLDECDRMMDMGFMPQLRNILEVIPTKRQNLLFSATFPERVERLSEEFLLWPTKIEVSPQATPVASVKQLKTAVPNIRTKLHFVSYLLKEVYKEDRALVFVRTKEQAEQISKYLERTISGGVRGLHSNKGQNTRLHSMSLFREGAIRVLVSTDACPEELTCEKPRLLSTALSQLTQLTMFTELVGPVEHSGRVLLTLFTIQVKRCT